VKTHDKFSLIHAAQSGDFVIVPVHCYDLFKGIALEYINLQRKIKLQAKDLNIVCWEECKTFFL